MSNLFYYHADLQSISEIAKIGVSRVFINDEIDWLFYLNSTLSSDLLLYYSHDKLDIQKLITLRRMGCLMLCRQGCCGNYIQPSLLAESIFMKPFVLERGSVTSDVQPSSFGVYIRKLFSEWISQTNYRVYAIHGCEFESIEAFLFDDNLKNKRIKLFGKPTYFDDVVDVFISEDISLENQQLLDSFIRAQSNNLLTIEDLKIGNVPVVDYYNSVSDFISDMLKFKPTMNNHNVTSDGFCFITEWDSNFSDPKGFKHVLVYSSIKDLPLKLISTTGDGYSIYSIPRPVVNWFSGIYAFRNFLQRRFIVYGDLFDVAKEYQSPDSINIAIFSISNVVNARRFRPSKNRGVKPISNVIGTLFHGKSVERVGFKFSYKHAKPSFDYGKYKDFTVTNEEVASYGYSFIDVRTFESLLYRSKVIKGGFDQFDLMFSILGIFTDISGCNIQNGLTSQTYDIKSMSYYLNSTRHLNINALHRERFLYLSKWNSNIKFKLPWMKSTAYSIKRETLDTESDERRSKNVLFLDYSGHFFNFLFKTDMVICSIKSHIDCIIENFNSYKSIDYNFFGIDIKWLYNESGYFNLESRTPNKLEESLWHTKEEHLVVLNHYRIIRKDVADAKYDRNYLKFMESTLKILRDDGRNGITVEEDIKFLDEHQDLLGEMMNKLVQ